MKSALPLLGILLALRPEGSQFRVNTYTTGDQVVNDVAAGPSGDFVVVWLDADEHRIGVFARGFDATGSPAGAVFRVNTYTTELQLQPKVEAGVDGFIVAWVSLNEDGDQGGIFAQLFQGLGPLGSAFRVNSATAGQQTAPSVARNPAGTFTVVYTGPDGDTDGVFVRRFLSSGAPLGPETRVNAATTGVQTRPAVAGDASGAFVVAWREGSGVDSEILARLFNPSGTPLASEFRVNSETTGGQDYPSVSRNPAGRFTVTWHTQGTSKASARSFSPAGAPLTGEVRVDTYGAFPSASPLQLPDGRFMVVFPGDSYDGAISGDVVLRQFDPAGAPIGDPLRVNTYTTGSQFRPTISGHARGFVVVWDSTSGDGSEDGVFGQRFSLLPVRGDANGDDQVNVSDVLYLINFLFAGGPAPIG